MVKIELENLSKHFGKVKAVDNINLKIKEKEFMTLLGPSGCGKTTILRCIAGLERLTSGNIYFDDELVNDKKPAERNVAMVFQSYALYPHMNVFQNLSFPLRMRKVSKDEIKKRVKETANLLRIEDLLYRKPSELSGGQRQRVALGRAIVRKPTVFLLDEPLSNLDAKLRVQMRTELKKLHEVLGITTIYVTHDQVEAMSISERITLIRDGAVQQVAHPNEAYLHPQNLWVAGFIGTQPMNLIECDLTEKNDKKILDAGEFILPLEEDLADLLVKGATSCRLFMGVRPTDISLSDSKKSDSVYKSEIYASEPTGGGFIVHLKIGDALVRAEAGSNFSAKSGDKVYLTFDVNDLYFFDKKTGKSLT